MKTRLALRRNLDWECDWYKRASRKRQDGRRLYVGHFRATERPLSFSIVRVPFWTRRPGLALRTICDSGCDPMEFKGQNVD
jgi:hypothetical protein